MRNYLILIITFLYSTTGLSTEPIKDTASLSSSSISYSNHRWSDDPIAAMLDSLERAFYCNSDETIKNLSTKNDINFPVDSIPMFEDAIVGSRIAALNNATPMLLIYNDAVEDYIDLYSVGKRGLVSRVLGLSQLYYPMFEEKLEQYGLPLELKHLAVVESALNPVARSRSGAVGLWQFIYSTGKYMDLNITSYIDERRDPYIATDAACRYLSHLYQMFGDWSLVLAAYNGGPGTVSRAIRNSGGSMDYWEIRPFLPAETRGYVPAFIAVNYIMNHAPEHNIYPTEPPFKSYDVDTVAVRKAISLEQLSVALGISKKEITFLNPMYKQGYIPQSEKPYMLVLPKIVAGLFLCNEQEVYAYQLENEEFQVEKVAKDPYLNITHVVRHGENLSLIAQRYGCRVHDIMEWNKMKTSRIYAKQRLKLVVKNKNYQKSKQEESKNTPTRVSVEKSNSPSQTGIAEIKLKEVKYLYHTVQPGDTLWDIAKLYNGASVSTIKSLNKIYDVRQIKPGLKLKISVLS